MMGVARNASNNYCYFASLAHKGTKLFLVKGFPETCAETHSNGPRHPKITFGTLLAGPGVLFSEFGPKHVQAMDCGGMSHEL